MPHTELLETDLQRSVFSALQIRRLDMPLAKQDILDLLSDRRLSRIDFWVEKAPGLGARAGFHRP